VTRLLLVRHGENRANLTHEFSCRKVDYPLTPKGRLQADQTARALGAVAVDEVWSSPLVRAQETARTLAQPHDLPVKTLELLREMDVGDLEGWQPQAEAWALYAGVMRRWLAGDAEATLPGGESRRALADRFRRALETIVGGRDGLTLVIVGHGGLFTHGMLALCAIADEREFLGRENHNCSITDLRAEVSPQGLGFRLEAWAAVGHLSGEAAVLLDSVPEGVQVKNLP